MASSDPIVSKYDCLLLDLDGVIYIGPNPVPHAADVLRQVREQFGTAATFITNNASRTAESVAQQLRDVGVDAAATEVVTSAQVAASYLAAELPAQAKVLIVGGEGLIEALTARGLVPVTHASDQPMAVVQGFHPDVGWRMLAEAAGALHTGLPWVATNLDMTLPTPLGPAPGNGSLVATLTTATGRLPVAVGKPEPPIIEEAMRRAGSSRPLIIGDRLDTDIQAANATGLDSMLVLTGVTTPAMLAQAPPHQRPKYVAADLRALLLPESASASFGGWECTWADGKLAVPARGSEPVAGIRAVASLCWAVSDAGQPIPIEALELVTELGAG